jgi:hypothetical protein
VDPLFPPVPSWQVNPWYTTTLLRERGKKVSKRNPEKVQHGFRQSNTKKETIPWNTNIEEQTSCILTFVPSPSVSARVKNSKFIGLWVFFLSCIPKRDHLTLPSSPNIKSPKTPGEQDRRPGIKGMRSQTTPIKWRVGSFSFVLFGTFCICVLGCLVDTKKVQRMRLDL